METIEYQKQKIEVEEIARPTWGVSVCRAIKSRDMYIEYLVSTGPYKIDIPHIYKLSVNEVAQYNAKTLDLALLCKRLLP